MRHSILLVALALGCARGAPSPITSLIVDDGSTYVLTTGQRCPPEGSATKRTVREFNREKNVPTAPAVIDKNVSLLTMLSPGDDEQRFDHYKGATVKGFVIAVKPGGVESCNCGASDLIDRDTHIELAAHPDAPPNQRVIVEVTPRLRKHRKQEGGDWTTPNLEKELKGKWAEVTGWLFFDAEHVGAAENTNPGGKDNWRATCWELHPVTDLLLDGPGDSLHPETLTYMQRARALAIDPERRAKLDARNRAVLRESTEEPP